eukprot:12445464-Alexandrium_andersonii.AAC.1
MPSGALLFSAAFECVRGQGAARACKLDCSRACDAKRIGCCVPAESFRHSLLTGEQLEAANA